MSRVRGRDTTPEIIVRKLAHGLGFRFRLQKRELPGKPDLVFPARKKIILVHGCFWHRHRGCPKATMPKSNIDMWKEKFRRNLDRDRKNLAELEQVGWRVLIVWQCETRKLQMLQRKLRRFLA
jgi:DNA mismatch endonuclease, patch repair protein